MGQLTVRNVDARVIQALKQRAAGHGRSVEAEHREILHNALLDDEKTKSSFVERATSLRARLRSSVDSTDVIRSDRDRATPA